MKKHQTNKTSAEIADETLKNNIDIISMRDSID
jgi:hypothetical protein